MPSDDPIYLVAQLAVRDRAQLLEYAKQVQPLMARYGGRLIAADPAVRRLEGDWQPDLLVIHRWDSQARFADFWTADEYQPVRQLRRRACESQIVLASAL